MLIHNTKDGRNLVPVWSRLIHFGDLIEDAQLIGIEQNYIVVDSA